VRRAGISYVGFVAARTLVCGSLGGCVVNVVAFAAAPTLESVEEAEEMPDLVDERLALKPT